MRAIVIGTGFGRYAMAPAFESRGWQVDLVSPRDRAATESALASPCDLVSIHAPPFMHAELVELALDHQCHVLCDKPFGRSSADAETMLAMVDNSDCLHFLNFEFRQDPLWQQMKILLDQGEFGEPLHISSAMHLSRGRKMAHGWQFDQSLGGGWIGAYASHFVDQLHWLFGDIHTLHSQPRIDVAFRPDGSGNSVAATAEDAITALFEMANGTTANLDSSFAAIADQPSQTLLLGSQGSALMHQGVGLTLTREDGSQLVTPFPTGLNPMQAALDRWLAEVELAIRENHQISPNFNDGLRCARVLDKMGRGAVAS